MSLLQYQCAGCDRHEIRATDEKSPFKVCGKCKTVRYCSDACQKANWSVHKLTCCKYDVEIRNKQMHGLVEHVRTSERLRLSIWEIAVVCSSVGLVGVEISPEDLHAGRYDRIKVTTTNIKRSDNWVYDSRHFFEFAAVCDGKAMRTIMNKYGTITQGEKVNSLFDALRHVLSDAEAFSKSDRDRLSGLFTLTNGAIYYWSRTVQSCWSVLYGF